MNSVHQPLVIQYRTYPYRWIILICFIMLILGQKMLYFGTLYKTMSTVYGYSAFKINLYQYLIPGITSIPFSFLNGYLLDNMGLKKSFIISSFFICSGAWIRILIDHDLIYLLISQLIIQIGDGINLGAANKLAVTWFSNEERPLITSILLYNKTASWFIATILPGIIFNGYDTKLDNINFTHGKSLFKELSLYQAIGTMILVIPSVILFKNKPQTPPSPSADSKRENFFNALKVLLNHKLFLILFVVQMMNYGTIMTFYHTQSFIYSPFGIGPTELTYFSIADSIGGLISLYCIGQWFKEYKKYKLSVILGYSGIIVSTLIQITMFKNYLNETNIWVLIGTQVLFGISEVPINGIFSELVCEVSYPIAEGTTYNIMNIGPQLWLLTMGGVFSSQIKEDKSMNFTIESFWIFNGILMMGLMIFSFGIQENLRRENFDKSSLQMNIQ